MATYDPRTDQIYGCKKGSASWWHERGHQQMQKRGIAPEMAVTQQVMLIFTIMLLAFGVKGFIVKMFAVGFIIAFVFEEILAWIVGFKLRAAERAK